MIYKWILVYIWYVYLVSIYYLFNSLVLYVSNWHEKYNDVYLRIVTRVSIKQFFIYSNSWIPTIIHVWVMNWVEIELDQIRLPPPPHEPHPSLPHALHLKHPGCDCIHLTSWSKNTFLYWVLGSQALSLQVLAAALSHAQVKLVKHCHRSVNV